MAYPSPGWPARLRQEVPRLPAVPAQGPRQQPRRGRPLVGREKAASDHLVVNDPYGEIDLVAGVYLNRNGKELRYSRCNFEPRWSVNLVDGRYVQAPRHGYAVFVSA